jgi:hypothetical protein
MSTAMSHWEIRHDFLAIDEGLGMLLHIDERDPKANWRVPIGQPQARDMQVVGGKRILLGHHHGYAEFELATGKKVVEFDSLAGVTAARRQPDGRTILAGVDLASSTGVVVLELDATNQEVRRTVFPGDYVRLIRQTGRGTYLMCCNDRIREGSQFGQYLREFPIQGFYHAWKAVRRANGNLLVSAGYGAFMVELDPEGGIVRRFGGKESVPDGVNPFFYGMFQLLPSGHVVLANWQGHGAGHGAKGVQLLEFDVRGEIVWRWSEAEWISSLQGVLVLDGLDVSRLHDEREGWLSPVG